MENLSPTEARSREVVFRCNQRARRAERERDDSTKKKGDEKVEISKEKEDRVEELTRRD